nr:reverse transcriptase domain-containing protein [Tanacetum cinerariifolium]
MSAMANTTPIVTTFTKTATKEKTPNGAETSSRINILDFYEEDYEDILPVMDKIHRDKRREVHTRLDFLENSRKSRRIREESQNSSAKTLSARYRNLSKRPQIRDRLRNNDGNVFGRLGHRRESAFKRLSDTYSPSTTKSGPDSEYSRDDSHSRGRCSSSMKRRRNSKSPLSRVAKSSTGEGGHWKSKSKRRKPIDEEDLVVPWSCEEVDPFTPRIRNFKSSRKKRMPNNVKTYDGTGDPEDHGLGGKRSTLRIQWKSTISNRRMEKHRGVHGEIETVRMKGPPEYMRISRFMHGVNNPELIKRLNEHVPKTLEEMMTATAAFI